MVLVRPFTRHGNVLSAATISTVHQNLDIHWFDVNDGVMLVYPFNLCNQRLLVGIHP